MKDCIFSPHCTELVCDKACPIFTETSYLLERNDISLDNPVFNVSQKSIDRALSVLNKHSGKLSTIISENTIDASNLLTYCAICENWKGNRLHCNVYNLKFSNYVESIQRSWSNKNPDESLEYVQIWSSTAKILIVSSIDYVQFKDFQSQTLLNLIHNRMNNHLTTIIVTPKVQTLVGSGVFFSRLQSVLREAVVTW